MQLPASIRLPQNMQRHAVLETGQTGGWSGRSGRSER
jgi:hypothetical protein